MLERMLADLVTLAHLAFVVFAVLGGLATLWWRHAPWLHVPAATWAAIVELCGWTCPLTPLENHLRRAGGEAGYTGGFVEHYLLPILYPDDLTREIQIALGLLVAGVNLVVYGALWRQRRTQRAREVESR